VAVENVGVADIAAAADIAVADTAAGPVADTEVAEPEVVDGIVVAVEGAEAEAAVEVVLRQRRDYISDMVPNPVSAYRIVNKMP